MPTSLFFEGPDGPAGRWARLCFSPAPGRPRATNYSDYISTDSLRRPTRVRTPLYHDAPRDFVGYCEEEQGRPQTTSSYGNVSGVRSVPG